MTISLGEGFSKLKPEGGTRLRLCYPEPGRGDPNKTGDAQGNEPAGVRLHHSWSIIMAERWAEVLGGCTGGPCSVRGPGPAFSRSRTPALSAHP